MRIARYSVAGNLAYGIVELAQDRGEYPDTVAKITGNPLAGPVNYTGERHDLSEVVLVAPVLPRSKVVGFANTYNPETGIDSDEPDLPMFLKPNTSVVGPDDPVIIPEGATDIWIEAELAVVISDFAKKLTPEAARKVIFGYTIGLDVTAKGYLAPGQPWTLVKSCDSFCPLGPWIVTHWDENDLAKAEIGLDLNNEPISLTSSKLLNLDEIAELISLASQTMTLFPGDVILTGTPAATVVQAGDISLAKIFGLGELRNPIMAD